MRTCDIIKYLRESRHMTQLDVARRSGISQATISALEKGTRQPSMEMLEKLAEFYDVPKSTFMREEEPADDDSVRVIAEAISQNQKLFQLFKKIRYFSDTNLDTILAVVNLHAGSR